jgi:hypothetical protein
VRPVADVAEILEAALEQPAEAKPVAA